MTKTTINTNTTIASKISNKIIEITERIIALEAQNDKYINQVDLPYWRDVLKGYVSAMNKMNA